MPDLSQGVLISFVSFILGFIFCFIFTSFVKRNHKKEKLNINDEKDLKKHDTPNRKPSKIGSDESYKMVLVVRTDLGMTKGKIAAQCSHATLGAYKKALIKNPEALENWEYYGQAKIALKVKSEEELYKLRDAAKSNGLVTHIVVDAGYTQIPRASKTVLAIGPDKVSNIDLITKHLSLL